VNAVPEQLFIGGTWRDASDGRTIDVHDPATGNVVARVPNASDGDLDDVLAAAAAGYEVCIPPPGLCVDNGAMIAAAGYFRLRRGQATPWDASADASLALVS
jgi:hypothetical protein